MDKRGALGCFFLALLLLTVPLPILAAAILAAAFHEGCHVLAVRLLGGRIEGCGLTWGGAILDVSGLPRKREALAAAAGPFGSLLLLSLTRWLPTLALCGLAQGLYNLLPVYPLDGGRILFCLWAGRRGEAEAKKVRAAFAWITLGLLSLIFVFLRMPLAIGFLLPLVPGRRGRALFPPGLGKLLLSQRKFDRMNPK